MFTMTREAVTNADCKKFAEQLVANGFEFAKPSVAEQVKIDWEMAHKLDLAGDKFTADGNLKAAKVCYSRALARATKAHNATI
jgi:hypothetical protein